MLGDRLFKGLLFVIFLAWIVVTGLLIRQNFELKEQVANLSGSSPPQSLAVGEAVAPLDLVDLEGAASRVEFDDSQETLLLVFSPGCPACRRNFPQWETVAETPVGDRQVLYVSTDTAEKTRDYVEKRGLEGPVLIAGGEVLDRLKVSRIPTTLRIGSDGVVTGSWVGVLSTDTVVELAAVR